MKIPIKSHTKVRRPESKYRIAIWGDNHSSQTIHNTRLVKDIYIGLDDPLDLPELFRDMANKYMLQTTPLRLFKDEWGKWTPDMVKTIDNIKLPKYSNIAFFSTPKPSLLTRVKERFKR